MTDTFGSLSYPPPISPPQVIGRQIQDLQDALSDAAEARSAAGFARRLADEIQRFADKLDAEHEAGVAMVNFGPTRVLHVRAIGFIEPSMITFHGLSDANEPAELIQHVHQIAFFLVAAPRLEPEVPKRRIGFVQPSSE